MKNISSIVGCVGNYRIVCLSKIINPDIEKRRCIVRRHKACVQGVVDYHSDLDIMSHLGTHVEAPFHHGDDLKDVVQLAPGHFIGRGVLLKLTNCKPRALVSMRDLDLADRGRVRADDVVILDSPYHHEPFVSSPDDRRPQLSREAAKWFSAKKVKAIGFGDGIAIENNPEHCIAFHDILMPKDIVFIEVLQNITALTQSIFLIIFLPLLILGLDASPTSVIAIEGIPGFTEKKFTGRKRKTLEIRAEKT